MLLVKADWVSSSENVFAKFDQVNASCEKGAAFFLVKTPLL